MHTLTDLARRALAVDEAFMALGNERFEADGATFIRNREAPDIWDANHVSEVTASTPEEIERLLERVEREFAGFEHRRFHLEFTTPPAFEARLALDGYEKQEGLLLLLEGDLLPESGPCDIRPVETEEDWRAYVALNEADWREWTSQWPHLAGFNEESARQMMRLRRSKSPPARHWLACVDGQPRGYLTSWAGTEGVGMLEDLFVQRDFRRRGIATALISQGVKAARLDGAGAVMIPAAVYDTPKSMYAALGFRPVAVKRNYLKRLKA